MPIVRQSARQESEQAMTPSAALAEVERLDRAWDRDCSITSETADVFIEAAPILARRVRELEAALSTLTRCAECGMCARNADCEALKEAKGEGRNV